MSAADECIRDWIAKAPPVPRHHVTLEMVGWALSHIPRFKSKFSFADIHQITKELNLGMDSRQGEGLPPCPLGTEPQKESHHA